MDESRRRNQIITAVNCEEPPESINPPLNEEELQRYNAMKAQLTELRKVCPRTTFELVELDW